MDRTKVTYVRIESVDWEPLFKIYGTIAQVEKIRRRTYIVRIHSGVRLVFRHVECTPATKEDWILQEVTMRLDGV